MDLLDLPIEKSISQTSFLDYQSVERRYFEHFYWCPSLRLSNENLEAPENEPAFTNHIKGDVANSTMNGDQVVMVHSNRVCLVGIAQSHPIIRDKLEITKLDFEFGDKALGQTRLKNHVRGKGKKGGQGIDERSVLCQIECKNLEGINVRFPIRSLCKGKLIEINELIVRNPNLIRDAPTSEGHIAIILPKSVESLMETKSRLLTEEDYYKNVCKK